MSVVKLEGADLARYDLADVAALKALGAGTADKSQQDRALKWIIDWACATHAWAFKDDERETNIALGRQFAGQQIIGILNKSTEQLQKELEEYNLRRK